MSARNLRASGCTPYFCNEFDKNDNGNCFLCHKPLVGMHRYKYPVPARSVYGAESRTPEYFAALNVQKIIPCDNMGGQSHRYACASCVSKQTKIKAPDLSLYPCPWVGEHGIEDKQIEEGNRIGRADLGIVNVRSYHPNAMNFLRQIGDMGVSEADVANQHPPMATLYREINKVKECIEFVHFDKYYGMRIDTKDITPGKRSPCFENYRHYDTLLHTRTAKNAILFANIYDENKFVEYFDEDSKQARTINLLENERLPTASGAGFGAASIFKQEENHKLLDRKHRWWDYPFSFIILNCGLEIGMIEFFITNHDSSDDLHHEGKSLFVYNIAADTKGHRITQCALWFAKHLALYLNRFTDVSTQGTGHIKRVFLSTSTLNTAFERDAPKCGFTRMTTLKKWWDCDYYCDLPWVQRYGQGTDVFPTNITGTGPEGSYLHPDMLQDRKTIVDRALRAAPGEVNPYHGQKHEDYGTKKRKPGVQRDKLPPYEFASSAAENSERKRPF